ncbi:hypothetical protein QWA68_009814 [Fusarium oxysporum]|nr:hypothetical protein QWA68_009814 [Fusarium oxysporum]
MTSRRYASVSKQWFANDAVRRSVTWRFLHLLASKRTQSTSQESQRSNSLCFENMPPPVESASQTLPVLPPLARPAQPRASSPIQSDHPSRLFQHPLLSRPPTASTDLVWALIITIVFTAIRGFIRGVLRKETHHWLGSMERNNCTIHMEWIGMEW